MRRGVNLGNVLDVDPRVAPVVGVDVGDLELIAEAGFDFVRLPVRWSAHAADRPPFAVGEEFAVLVDRAVQAALDLGLGVVLDLHHAAEVMADPVGQQARFRSIWAQVGKRHAGRPASVAFELLNEPRSPITAAQWNGLLRDGLQAVRESNPTRRVVIGPSGMSTVAGLPALRLPDDPHVVATVHYYEPFRFTHQGAPWERRSEQWLGTTWGSAADVTAARADLAEAAAWAEQRRVPLLVGEFGAYERADLDARVRWTRTVRREADRHGMAWCYWDFGSDFGLFDRANGRWCQPLLDALLGPD